MTILVLYWLVSYSQFVQSSVSPLGKLSFRNVMALSGGRSVKLKEYLLHASCTSLSSTVFLGAVRLSHSSLT